MKSAFLRLVYINALLFSFQAVSSQTVEQQLISGSGDCFIHDGYNISWSIGEVNIETKHASNYIITQGFHQLYNIKTVSRYSDPDVLVSIDFKTYPNPVSEVLNIVLSSPMNESIELKIFNLEGKLIASDIIEPKTTFKEVNVTNLANSVYVFLFVSEEKFIKSFIIVKK